jgi:anti-sigma B factor antagonist
MLDIKIKKYETIYIIQLSGKLTLYTVEALNKAFNDLMGQNIDNFIIDMTQVEYIDSSGIGLFVNIKKNVEKSGPRKRLRIVNCNNVVKKIIQLAKLSDFLPLADGIKETVILMQNEIQKESNG